MQLQHQDSSPQLAPSAHDVPTHTISRKRSKFSLFGSRPSSLVGDESSAASSSDWKRSIIERRSGSKTPTQPPSASHSPRLSIVGTPPPPKASKVLGVGVQEHDPPKHWWHSTKKLRRSNSRSSFNAPIQSLSDTAGVAIGPDHMPTSISLPTTPRTRSRHGRPSRGSSQDAGACSPPISKPSNFIHITHTGPHHFSKLHSTTQNDLVAEFSAVRAAQTPQRTLLGIKVSELSSRRSSVDNSPSVPSLVTDSSRSSVYNRFPRSPTASDGRQHRTLHSKNSFSLPFRSGELPSPRRMSSNGSLSSRTGGLPSPGEDLPPLPMSNYTSARVSLSLDEYVDASEAGDAPSESEWCHAITCDPGVDDEQIPQAYPEPVAVTTDDAVPAVPVNPGAHSTGLAPPAVGASTRSRSPSDSTRSSRSGSSSAPAASKYRAQEPNRVGLRHELVTLKAGSDADTAVKRRSGLFSSWTAESDSESDFEDGRQDALEVIAEDPMDALESPIVPAMSQQKNAIPEQSLPDSAMVDMLSDEESSTDIDEAKTTKPTTHKPNRTSSDAAARRQSNNSLDRDVMVQKPAQRLSVDGSKAEKNVPVRKNSNKTVRFKEDLCSIIREEVARRTQPTHEEEAERVQASLEDLETTLARLEAELVQNGTDRAEARGSSRASTDAGNKPRTEEAARHKRQTSSPTSKLPVPQTKSRRPLSEGYANHASVVSKASGGRVRTTDPLPTINHDHDR